MCIRDRYVTLPSLPPQPAPAPPLYYHPKITMLPFQCYPFCHSPPSLFLLLLHLLTSIAVSQQPCQPGSFLARNGSCLPCPPGTSQPQSAQTACVPCQGPEIAPEEGSAECTPCGVNELPMEHNKKCTCQSGSGRIQDDQPCKICPPGTFSEIEPVSYTHLTLPTIA